MEEFNNSDLDPWTLYLYALKSPVSKNKYQKRLEKFLDFLKIDGNTVEDKSKVFVNIAVKEGTKWVFSAILRFMQLQIERVNKKEIVGSTVRNYLKSIKLFCEVAVIQIAWKKITRGLPRAKNYADDRIPTIEEIRKLLEYPDRRIKAIIFTMASSGIRLGAWDYLKWGHIKPIEKDGKIAAAKIIVYAEEEEQYFSFISKEAYESLNEWMEYRKKSGETITENSWLMRDLWDTEAFQGKGWVTKPKKLASSGIKRLVERAIWAQGLRTKLENGKKRHPFPGLHCWRKWFKTRCEIAGMKPANIELLLSHSIGISNSYYRPTENELLDDYLKVMDLLMFDTEEKLQKQIQKYQQESHEESYIIKGKLHEKDEQIKSLTQQFSVMQNMLEKLISSVSDTTDQQKANALAESLFSSGVLKSADFSQTTDKKL